MKVPAIITGPVGLWDAYTSRYDVPIITSDIRNIYGDPIAAADNLPITGGAFGVDHAPPIVNIGDLIAQCMIVKE